MWLHVPSTFLDSARASAGLNSLLARHSGEEESKPSVYVTVNGMPSRRPYSQACKLRPAVRLLSGTILRPSMAGLGVESWIAWLRACRAQPTALPGSGAETTMNGPGAVMTTDRSGISSESPEKSCPNICSWRTCLNTWQADIFDDSERAYSDWATESRQQSSCLRETLAQHKGANGCLYWPCAKTPSGGANCNRENRPQTGGADLQESAQNWASCRAEDSERTGAHRGTPDTLSSQVDMWAAPSASCAGKKSRGGDRIDEPLLGGQAQAWAAARANDAKGSDYQNQTNGTITECLPGQAKSWAAPAARDTKWPNGPEHAATRERTHEDQLPNQAVNWATPRASTCNGIPCPEHTGNGSRIEDQAAIWASFRQAADTGPIPNGSASLNWTPPACPRLNPVFQWWLMGWPSPAAIFSVSGETEWCRWLRRWRSIFCSTVLTIQKFE